MYLLKSLFLISENENDLEKELLKEIEEEEEKHFKGFYKIFCSSSVRIANEILHIIYIVVLFVGGKSGGDNEEEEEEEEELMDEIYDEYRHDPRASAWWSRKSNSNNSGGGASSISSSTTRPRTRKWLRFKQKASRFFNGVHHVLKKAQTYAPHIIKGAKYAAALLGKRKRELVEMERRQKLLRDEIRDMEDEMMKKKRK